MIICIHNCVHVHVCETVDVFIFVCEYKCVSHSSACAQGNCYIFKSTCIAHMQVSKLNCVRHDSVNSMAFFCMFMCTRHNDGI